jgi:hypothetical protein
MDCAAHGGEKRIHGGAGARRSVGTVRILAPGGCAAGDEQAVGHGRPSFSLPEASRRLPPARLFSPSNIGTYATRRLL